jgi:hypothetical protein
MADDQDLIDKIIEFFQSGDEQREFVQAAQAGRTDDFMARNFGSCGTADLDRALPGVVERMPAGAARSALAAVSAGNVAVVGGQALPPPQSAAARLAQVTNVYQQSTTNIDASRDTTLVNDITAIGSNVNLNQPVASGDGAVAIGRDANAPVTAGDGNVVAQAGGDVTANTGGGELTNIDNSNLAGVGFGDGGGDNVGAAPGGAAAGGGGIAAAPGATVADDGGAAASGGSAAQAIDASTTIDASADTTQLAGGDIDQSADTDVTVAAADDGGIALADQVDSTDPMAT